MLTGPNYFQKEVTRSLWQKGNSKQLTTCSLLAVDASSAVPEKVLKQHMQVKVQINRQKCTLVNVKLPH